jgi:hypothetical protein
MTHTFSSGQNTTTIEIDLVIEEVEPFDDQSKNLKLSVVMGVTWIDTRLSMMEDCKVECVLIEKFIEFIENIIYRIYRKYNLSNLSKNCCREIREIR